MNLIFKIFFVIGASGAGKTSTLEQFNTNIPSNFCLLHFDSIGIPHFKEMEKIYGSIEEWQRVKTIEWVEKIKNENLDFINVIFDAQIRPAFIKEACQLHNIDYRVVLFDCADEERKRRLIIRGQPELADQNMMNWANFLRKECQKYDFKIIDNTSISLEQTCEVFSIWLSGEK